MSRSSYLYQAPHQGIGQASYNNRMAKERGEAQQRLQSRDNAYDFGPMQPERSALARMADQATMGQPVNLNEAERLQKAAIDRQLIEQGQRQKAIDEAVGRPSGSSSPAPRTVPGMSFKMKPKEKTEWDPFNNPEMRGMTGMEKRAARFAEGGLVRDQTPLPGYAMGGPVMRDYGIGGPGMRGYAMGGLVAPPLKGGLGQMMPNGQYLRPQKKPDFMINQGYAEGGPVEGPGGPKDDLINAKLSDGEFVMPAEVVEFYGLDRLHKMMAKAKEGLNEIKPAPQALPTPLPVTMPQPTPAFAYGGMATRDSLPGYKLGGQFDEEEKPTDAMDPLPQAIAAQQRAVEANQNPSFLDYYFPTEGVEASQAASSATQRATDSLGRFFEAEAAATAADRERMAETRQRQDAMMNYAPGSPAPRPAPSPLPEFLGQAAPLFPQGRPVLPSPATPMMAPASAPSPQVPFVADPATLAAMRSRRADLRAQPAPAPANGRQPAPVLSSPMDVPLMRPAPLTMTEKEQQAKPISRSRTPESNPEFEAALAGLTGMQKRRARAGLQMEEATNQRNQGRAAIEQAKVDARNERIRVQNLQDMRDNMIIADQIRQAAENRNIGNTSALNAAQQQEQEQRDAAKRAQPVQAVPVLLPDGTVSKGYYGANNMILPFQTVEPKALSVEPGAAKALLSSPQASTLNANTLAEIVSDTRYDIATRELARRQLAKVKTAPEERRYIDPDNYRPFTLKPGERLPEGSRLVPLTPEAAPAPASGAAQPTEAHKALLRSNPSQAAAYDAKFGPGSAARDLK